MAEELFNDTIRIDVHGESLVGELVLPEGAKGLVIVTDGTGQGVQNQQNRAVAQHLQRSGYATLLVNLLTPEEDKAFESQFDLPKLTQRLVDVVYWIQQDKVTTDLNIGFFGTKNGAAASAGAAAALGDIAKAVVSCHGRADLAAAVLPDVHAPVLLIVGGKDEAILKLNQNALEALQGIKDLQLVPDVTHMFEEPGSLEMAAQLATDWFRKYLPPGKLHPLHQDQP
ncbi:MAG TPA: dienelactone hydrolase family protein [Pontibacter sp.]